MDKFIRNSFRVLIALVILMAIDSMVYKWVEFNTINNTVNTPDIRNMRSYQVELQEDYILLYDDNRIVGSIPFDTTDALTKLVIKDNE